MVDTRKMISELADAFQEIIYFDFHAVPKKYTLARVIGITINTLLIFLFQKDNFNFVETGKFVTILILVWAVITSIQYANVARDVCFRTIVTYRLMLVSSWIATISLFIVGFSMLGVPESLSRFYSFILCCILIGIQLHCLKLNNSILYFFSMVLTLLLYIFFLKKV